MPTHIDLTPSWRGVLQLLLAAWRDGSAKGQRMAEEELIRMAQLADAYIRQQKLDAEAREIAALKRGDIQTDDTARIEATLDYVALYNEQLDRLEMPPNGDDYTAMVNGVIDILQHGNVPVLHLTEKGR